MKKFLLLSSSIVICLMSGCKQHSPLNQTTNEKTLVVYYSATGHTKEVAQVIAKQTQADLFELHPKQEYSQEDLDWRNKESRVNHEHDDESLRNIELISTKVEHWDEYKRIFIGYPIWWSIAAWPVNSFVKNNDFTNKTVIPFCTSASSGVGESDRLLSLDAHGGNWQKGVRFSSSVSEEEIREWVLSH